MAENNFEQQVLQMLGNMNQRFDGIDQRLDGIDQRLDGFDKKFEEVNRRFTAVEGQLSDLNRKMDGIQEQVVANSEALTDLKEAGRTHHYLRDKLAEHDEEIYHLKKEVFAE